VRLMFRSVSSSDLDGSGMTKGIRLLACHSLGLMGLSLWVVDPERRAVATLSFVPHSAVSRSIPSFEHMVRW